MGYLDALERAGIPVNRAPAGSRGRRRAGNRHALTVTTIHQAKGREWDVVITGSLDSDNADVDPVGRELQFLLPTARLRAGQSHRRLRPCPPALRRLLPAAKGLLVLTARGRVLPRFNPIWEDTPRWTEMDPTALATLDAAAVPYRGRRRRFGAGSRAATTAKDLPPQASGRAHRTPPRLISSFRIEAGRTGLRSQAGSQKSHSVGIPLQGGDNTMKQRPGDNAWPRGPPMIAVRPARPPDRGRSDAPGRNHHRTPPAPGVRKPRADLEIPRSARFRVSVDRAQLQNHNPQRGNK